MKDKKLNKKLILMYLKAHKSYNYSDPRQDVWNASVWARDVMGHMCLAKDVDRRETLHQFKKETEANIEAMVSKYPEHAIQIKKELRAAADHIRPLVASLKDDAKLSCGCSGSFWGSMEYCPLASSPTLDKLGEYS